MIDIGANLAHDSFDDDRETVLERARQAGVEVIVVTGSSIDSNAAAADIAAATDPAWPRCYYTTGVHPHHADDYDRDMHDTLARQMASEDVVAAGECGLDYFRNFAQHDAQAHAFTAQLGLAIDNELPVFLHQRDAHDDFLTALKPRLAELPRAVAHCFTAGERELHDYLALDLYIGITGWICDERRGAHLLELVGDIPADRLLVETDAPYLLPRSLRPRPKTRRNEPCWLGEVVKTIADARGESTETVGKYTAANARRFFALPDAG